MGWHLLNHTTKIATAGYPTSVTTAAISSLGCDFIIAVGTDSNDLDATFSDSASNTWQTAFSSQPTNLEALTVLYTVNPITAASHTFTYPSDGFGNNPSLFVACLTGARQTSATCLDQSNSANSALGTSSVQPGSITPTTDNQLIFNAINWGSSANTISISPGAIIDKLNAGSFSLATATAFLGQAARTASNPTWTTTSGAGYTACQLSFFPSNADLDVASTSNILTPPRPQLIGVVGY